MSYHERIKVLGARASDGLAYIITHYKLNAVDRDAARTFRALQGRPRQGELRRALERKRAACTP